ncbi:NUDIX hydrolase [Fictibacillus barbaricus]|uniref:8-oxo-dGTP diphosphatase n=1 Tax=Fictibacillus barbaricus TaxID=182136 RepID=A0ABU1TW26_9BACL|nr:NUDIX hydrolase [Fictibacillus barbaricus]MDR7071418.1 8-oxo-dGTP diphosphatase [Fictibacillus barbaricus]
MNPNFTNNHYEYMDLLPVDEGEIEKYKKLAGSFAVITCEGKFLICYNKWRNQWELPAGKREHGETPKECAIRELYEETGQRVDNLKFKGLLKLINRTNGELKFNPVYYGELESLQPFHENEETSDIMLWDTEEEIGYFDLIDLQVLKKMK